MNRKGFTLIELLVVVVVIGILAAVGIPKFASSKSKAYVTAMRSDLRNLLNAQEAFFADSSHYSDNLTSLNFTPTRGVTPPVITVTAGAWTAKVGHTQLASAECGVGVNADNPVNAAVGDGQPACR